MHSQYRNLLATTALVGALAAAPAFAEPVVSLGVNVGFGAAQKSNLGISARVLSDNRKDRFVGALGGIYYPSTNKFGLDAGIGYNFGNNTTATVTYDFVNDWANIGLGWAQLAEPSSL